MLFTSLEFFVFLPLALAVFALRRCAALDRAAVGELRFLRLRPADQPRLSRRCDARRLCQRPRPRAGKQRPWRTLVLVAGLSPCSARSSPSNSMTSLPARSRAGQISSASPQAAAPRRHRAGRLFILRLLRRELSHRRLCRTRLSGRQSLGRCRAVYRLVSEDPRRSDRARHHFSAAALAGLRADPGPLCARAAIDRLGPVQESRHRRQPCATRRPQLQDRRLRPADRAIDQHLFLRLPDLLRLFRLYRYRDRHLLAVRHPADGEFPPPLSVAQHGRILGASAGTSRSAAGFAIISTSRWAAAAPVRCAAPSTSWSSSSSAACGMPGSATASAGPSWSGARSTAPIIGWGWRRAASGVASAHPCRAWPPAPGSACCASSSPSIWSLSWVFFRAKSMHDAVLVLKKIGARLTDLPHLLTIYPFSAEHSPASA